MRLMECLNQSDMKQLTWIAKHHQLSAPSYSKNAILQELLSKFTEPDYLSTRVHQSQIPLQTVIRELAIHGRDSYAKDELSPVIRRILSALKIEQSSSQEIIMALIHEGLLFEMHSTFGRMYIFPEDLWKKINILTTKEIRAASLAIDQMPVIVRDDGTAIARDTASLLFFCAKNPQRLTLDGSLYKRAQQQIMQLFEIKEELLPERTGWRFGFHPHFRNYPERFALIYDFLSTSETWIEKNSDLLVEEGASQALLMISEEKRTELIFRYYLQVYRSAIPHLLRIINKIGEMTRGGWVMDQVIRSEIVPWVNEYFYETKDNMIHQHILRMLVYLGFLKEGEFSPTMLGYHLSLLGATWLGSQGFNETEDTQLTPQSDIDEAVTITPDFDMIVPSPIESVYGFNLQKIAQRIKNDRIRIFRLTHESISNALAIGWTKTQLLAFLNQVSHQKVPKNVEITVSSWCDAYEQITVENWCVITCQKHSTLSEIVIHPHFSSQRIILIDELRFAVDAKEKESVAKQLHHMGYSVMIT